jgi:hypothetical protein
MKVAKVALVLMVAPQSTDSFSVATPLIPRKQQQSLITLKMAKGLNKAKNKQAALARKLQLAREQKDGTTQKDDKTNEASIASLSDAEIKKKNDQLRFEQLLKQEASNVLNNYSSDGYLSKEQEEEEISAVRRGVDRLFEGDPAPYDAFELLVDVQSNEALGVHGAKQVVPKAGDFLIVLTDPRFKSDELRDTMKSVNVDLPAELRKKLIIVNADSPAENRRWLKKNDGVKLNIYSDEKKEWLKAYTALGEKRLSMGMYIIADERIQKLARDVDGVLASRVIQNAVKSL